VTRDDLDDVVDLGSERRPVPERADLRDHPVPDDLPPLADWPPPEILERWAARRAEAIRRRRARRRLTGLVVLIAMVVGAVVMLSRGHPSSRTPTPAEVQVRSGAVALSLDLGIQRVVAVMAVRDGSPAAIVAIPSSAEVDITGGDPITVSEAAVSTGLMVAAVQAALDRRVEHHVTFDSTALMNVVDGLRGIDVQAEAPFTFGTQLLGPGPVHLTGGAVVAYLEQATPDDLTGRWEEVLAGLFSAKGSDTAWRSLIGQSDSIEQVRVLLDRASNAIVVELPTAPNLDGGIEVDSDASADLVSRYFGAASGQRLVRVVILNGNGRATVGRELAELLAPAGYRVVAAQDAFSHSVTQTEIVAGGDAFEQDAEHVQAILGVGMVYVDSQPTGVADITIKVGKDFKSG
jgi:LytR cell envelope-related transcriptional attenuator/cell envelope-related transcriptional attenuator-like protein